MNGGDFCSDWDNEGLWGESVSIEGKVVLSIFLRDTKTKHRKVQGAVFGI